MVNYGVYADGLTSTGTPFGTLVAKPEDLYIKDKA